MVIHELATNSVKYGALSCETGFLDVSSKHDGDDISLIWAETGGPGISETPELKGYGSQLTERTVRGQLGGGLSYDWQESGLWLRFAFPRLDWRSETLGTLRLTRNWFEKESPRAATAMKAPSEFRSKVAQKRNIVAFLGRSKLHEPTWETAVHLV